MNDNNEIKVYESVKPTKYDKNELIRLSKLKLTKIKQKKFIDLYSKFPNMAKCAKQCGVSLTSIYNTMNRDPEFKNLVMDCRQKISEDMKEAMVTTGLMIHAQGAKDRQLWLAAYDPDFKKQPEIQINQQINIDNRGQLDNILNKILPKSK